MSKYLTTLAKRALRRMSGEQPPRDDEHDEEKFEGLVPYGSSDEETELASDEEDRSSNADTELASDNDEDAHSNANAADEEEDRQSNAGDEPAVNDEEDEDDGPPPVNAVFYDSGEGDDDDEAGRDYGPHYENHPDYESFPATGPEPEDEGDDDGESFATTFFGAPPSPDRSEDDGDNDHNVDEEEPGSVEGSGSGSGSRPSGGFVLDDNDERLEYVMDGQVYHVEHSDSSSESDGTSDNDASSDDDEGSRSPPRSRSPDVYDVPQTASQDIDANDVFVEKLSTLSDAEILDAMLGVNHRAVPTHRNPTPPPSPGTLERQKLAAAQPAPPPAAVVIRPEVAKRLAEIRSGGGRLTRTMNGDAWVPTGTGQYMSSRTGRVTGQAFAQNVVEQQQRNGMLHLAQGIDTGRVVVVIRDDDPDTSQSSAPSSRSSLSSSDSRDVGAVDQSLAAEESSGDSSTSNEVTSSQRQQVLAAPVDAPTSPTRKRSREESSDSEAETELNTDDEASPEKRRRVLNEEQPGSPAVLRLRPCAPTSARTQAGSFTAATQTNLQSNTAAAAAPLAENEGAAVVEPTERAAHGSDETPTASTSVIPAAAPAQEAAPTAGPARQPRGRGRRASPSPAVPVRRSRRIPIVAEAARLRAAEVARRAADAAPVARRRGRGRGKGKGKGGA